MFEIEAAGKRVSCAISREALQDISGRRPFTPVDLIRCFAGAQSRIEAIAAGKFKATPESVSGIVSVWADDIDELPAAPPGPAASLPALPACS